MTAHKTKKLEELLKEAFKLPLPGPRAQYKMAPKGRQKNIPSANKKGAAILILIYPKENNFNTVFIKRNLYDGPHSGQVSFPGGKYDDEDLSLEKTALRETYEEIGVKVLPESLLGKLTPLYIPISNFDVHPFVAITDNLPIFNIDLSEVQYLIETPLNYLIKNPIGTMDIQIAEKKIPVPCFPINGEQVWGATAMILNEFIELLKNHEQLVNFLQ